MAKLLTILYLFFSIPVRGVGAEQSPSNKLLIQAASSGELNAVQKALSQGASVNARDADSVTVLMLASFYGHSNVVQLLLEKGASVNAQTGDGRGALWFAVDQQHAGLVKLLLEKGADANASNGRTPLLCDAAYEDSVEIAKLLISKGADINAKNADGFTPLHFAANLGSTNVLKLLLSKGAEVNLLAHSGKTPLGMVDPDAMPIGSDPNVTVDLLLEYGAAIRPGRTALMTAAQLGRVDSVKALLAKGSDVNEPTSGGATALMFACNQEISELLLLRGAKLNVRDKAGLTPLHYAAFNGNVEVVDTLLKHNAPINSKASDGNTPLMLAASLGLRDDILVDSATYSRYAAVVLGLVNAGADVTVTNADGKTALGMVPRGLDTFATIKGKGIRDVLGEAKSPGATK